MTANAEEIAAGERAEDDAMFDPDRDPDREPQPGASRKRSSITELSGAGGLHYAEIRKKPSAPSHPLFRAREREKQKKAKEAQQAEF